MNHGSISKNDMWIQKGCVIHVGYRLYSRQFIFSAYVFDTLNSRDRSHFIANDSRAGHAHVKFTMHNNNASINYSHYCSIRPNLKQTRGDKFKQLEKCPIII